VGADHVVVMDVHNLSAFQNAWRIGTDHLAARRLFVDYVVKLNPSGAMVVVSPDGGGLKRAEEFRQALSEGLSEPVSGAFVEKYRSDEIVTGGGFAGNVSGRIAVIIDDIINTGTTVVRAAEACRQSGAAAVYAAASHGMFSARAAGVLSQAPLTKVVVTN